jgi:hypothetical protein
MRMVFALPLMLVLCGCQAQAPPEPVQAPDPRDALHFDPTRAELDRPCSLIAIRDVEWLTGKPYFDTLAANRTDGARTRCTMAVGEGAVQNAVQIDVHQADSLQPAEALFAAQCRTTDAAPPPPTVTIPACLTLEGAYAAHLGDRVVVASVRRDPAFVNQALSLRLLNLVTSRAAALTDG